MSGPSRIFIGLGANLPGASGETPIETCRHALALLKGQGVDILAVSPVYETAPWPPSDQPWYTNAVVGVATDLKPEDLLQTLLGIEQTLGRVREKKNDPRIIDLDLIDYGETILPGKEGWLKALEAKRAGGFFLPHIRAHKRVFVLKPLLDIAPGWVHPALLKCGQELLATLKEPGQIRPLKERLFIP